MNLSSLQATLRSFAAERHWEPFHTPKNLAMALMVEAAELAEIFQWMTPEESVKAHGDKVVQERIADEVADVLLYLLQLADHSAIDLKRAVGRKLVKNAKKHPPTAIGAKGLAVTALAPHAHVLVDWENVQPTGEDLLALVPDATDLWVFHGKTQRGMKAKVAAFGDNLTLVPITRSGKNALDFHLSFYMGYIASRNPDARFVVVSNDQGYSPMLDHARDLGFAASQVGWAPKRSAAKKASGRAEGEKKPVTTKTRGTRQGAKAPKAVEAVEAVVAVDTPATGAAAKKAVPVKAAASRGATRKSKAAMDTAIADPSEASGPAAPVAVKKPAAKKTAAKAASKAAGAASAPAAAPTPTRSRSRKAAAPAPVVAPVPVATVSDKAYAHVLASLRKSRDRPARTARLYSAVRSLLEGGKAGDAAVEAVVQRLIADGHASPDGKGGIRLTF